MKTKPITILLVGLATIVVGCSTAGLHGNGEHIETSPLTETGEGQFPTVGLEERVEVMIPFSVSQVCPLFEPAGRFLMYDWWNPTILQEAEGKGLEGLIMSDHGFGLDLLLKVTKHAPDEGHIQYIVLWGDFELQRIDITCIEGGTANSTQVVWNEQNTGMYKNGSSAVTTYVTDGHLRNNVENYARNATEYLKGQ